MRLRILNHSKNSVLATHASVADTPISRTRGLIDHAPHEFTPGNGLLFPECNAIHTVEMKFPIDVLFIDGDHSYERVVAELKLYLPRMAGAGTVLLHDTHSAPFIDRSMVNVGEALDDTLPGMGLKWEDYPGVCGLGLIRMPVTEPCYFCHAQARGRWTPETESQTTIVGNGPVDVCDGCRITASRM